jgi:hypothetical protein
MIRIGIDPAFRIDGFGIAIFDSSDRTMSFKMFADFIEFFEWLNNEDSPKVAKCVIENSNLQNATFDKRGSKEIISRKSRNVGANQAVSQLTVIACRKKYGKGNVLEISPKRKGAKLNEVLFSNMLKTMGIKSEKKKHNQDNRDAGKMALRKM